MQQANTDGRDTSHGWLGNVTEEVLGYPETSLKLCCTHLTPLREPDCKHPLCPEPSILENGLAEGVAKEIVCLMRAGRALEMGFLGSFPTDVSLSQTGEKSNPSS